MIWWALVNSLFEHLLSELVGVSVQLGLDGATPDGLQVNIVRGAADDDWFDLERPAGTQQLFLEVWASHAETAARYAALSDLEGRLQTALLAWAGTKSVRVMTLRMQHEPDRDVFAPSVMNEWALKVTWQRAQIDWAYQ